MSEFEPTIRRCRVSGFVLEGARLIAMQNARALHRMMNIMRETGAPNV
jgi:hypothetical protein